MVEQGLLGQGRVCLHDDDLDDLAGPLVGLADGRDLGHARVQGDGILDLVRVDLEARDHDHVLLAVGDPEEAAFIHGAQVAGAKPAVAGEHLGGFVGTVPVARHHLRAAHADLPDLAGRDFLAAVVEDRDLRRRNRQADRPGPIRDVQRAGDHHGRGLGQPVAFDDGHAGALLPAVGHHALHRHAAGAGELQRAGVHVREFRRIEQRAVQRVDADEHRERVLLQVVDEGVHVPRVGHQHGVRAELQQHEAGGQRIHVIQRQRTDEHFLAHHQVAGHPRRHLLHVGHQVAVRQDGALGDPRRAAGVLEKGRVLPVQRHVLQRQPVSGAQGCVEFGRARDLPVGHRMLHVAHHRVREEFLDHREQVADLGRDDGHLPARVLLEHLLQRVREVLQHHDGRGARVQELVLQLGRGVLRVDVHHHQAGPQHAEQGHRVLQQVGHHDRHPVALAQPQGLLQVGGEVAAGAVEPGVGERRPHVAVGGRFAEAQAASHQDLPERGEFLDIDLGRHPRRVVGQPDSFHVGVLFSRGRQRTFAPLNADRGAAPLIGVSARADRRPPAVPGADCAAGRGRCDFGYAGPHVHIHFHLRQARVRRAVPRA